MVTGFFHFQPSNCEYAVDKYSKLNDNCTVRTSLQLSNCRTCYILIIQSLEKIFANVTYCTVAHTERERYEQYCRFAP